MTKKTESAPGSADADVLSRFNAWAKGVRDRPSIPVNPKLAQEEFARRAAARREMTAARHERRRADETMPGRLVRVSRRWRMRRGTVLSVAATVLLLTGAGALVLSDFTQTQQHEAVMAEIASKRADVQQSDTVAAAPAVSGDELAALLDEELTAARTAADAAAALQNALARPADIAVPTEDVIAARQGLAALFVPGTYLIQDDQIFSAADGAVVALLGAEEVDPRMEWYFRLAVDGTLTASEGYSWSTVSVATSLDDVRAVNVLWLCRNTATGAVLSWARASYSLEQEAFTSLQVTNTSIGDFVEELPDSVPDIATDDANGATGDHDHDETSTNEGGD